METEQIEIIPKSYGYLVILYLSNDKEYKNKRVLGEIKNRAFFTERKPNHLLRINNSLGFNYKLIRDGGDYFDFIVCDFNFQILQTSREYFLANGTFLHFQKNKLEKQIFLPLDKFGMDKVGFWNNKKKIENERNNNPAPPPVNLQGDLFSEVA